MMLSTSATYTSGAVPAVAPWRAAIVTPALRLNRRLAIRTRVVFTSPRGLQDVLQTAHLTCLWILLAMPIETSLWTVFGVSVIGFTPTGWLRHRSRRNAEPRQQPHLKNPPDGQKCEHRHDGIHVIT